MWKRPIAFINKIQFFLPRMPSYYDRNWPWRMVINVKSFQHWWQQQILIYLQLLKLLNFKHDIPEYWWSISPNNSVLGYKLLQNKSAHKGLISLWNFIKAEIQCERRCILAPPSLPPPTTLITHIICLCVCTCILSSTSLVKRFLMSDQLIDHHFLFYSIFFNKD